MAYFLHCVSALKLFGLIKLGVLVSLNARNYQVFENTVEVKMYRMVKAVQGALSLMVKMLLYKVIMWSNFNISLFILQNVLNLLLGTSIEAMLAQKRREKIMAKKQHQADTRNKRMAFKEKLEAQSPKV